MALRIGIEAQRIFRSKKHGMDMVALETIRHLQQTDSSGFEFFVFVKPDSDVCLESGNGVTVVEVPGTTYPYWEQVMLPAAVQKYKIDLLHCTSNTAPLQLQIPLLLTLHDIIYLEKKGMQGASLYQKLGYFYRKWNVPRIVHKAEQIITVSEFEKKRIINHFGEIPGLKVVYNGISPKFSIPYAKKQKDEIKKKYNLPDSFIFFLGNTDPKKNLNNVLKSVIDVLSKCKNESLQVLIADYSSDALKQQLVRLGKTDLMSRFILPGYIPNTDLPGIYYQTELFLYPSLRESFGIPIIEAQACGAPVITSNTSSMPEVAGKDAWLVNPENCSEITNAALSILENTMIREKLIEAGIQNSGRFSWANTANQTLQIYKEILER
ncbi:MAG: glycosyltransferase family 4 protein [Balneolales bacterium]|nr:glycosyltransferase family 4 protein [Balneolales bacterium]